MMTASNTNTSAPTRRRGPVGALIDLFSSVWFGIFLLVLLFIYSSIGSALPPVRQSRFLELTEFEWFHWWVFDVLIALFALNLIVTTLRKIPLRPVNYGVWMIHLGILTLCAGSVYYFGTKIEGDVPLFRRQVVIQVPGAKKPVQMLARPGTEASVEGLAGTYQFSVSNIQPTWPLQSEPDKGKLAYSVQVLVKPPQGEPFIRQLLAGYPQYTEDVIPGKGRAVKSTGKKLLDESIQLALDYAPQSDLFIQDSAALYVRIEGAAEWHERPIDDLPHYHERIADHDLVFGSRELGIPLDPLDLTLPPADDQDPLAGIRTTVTGYLRYAHMEADWIDGGNSLNPVIGLELHLPDHSDQSLELAALSPHGSSDPSGLIEFKWIESLDERKEFEQQHQPMLHIEVPEHDVVLDVPVERFASGDPQATFSKIEGTEYEYLIRNKVDNLRLNDGRTVSVLLVDIRDPDGQFTRMVADDPQSTRDMSSGPTAGGHDIEAPDERIVMQYLPSKLAPLVVCAGPEPVGIWVYFASQWFEPIMGQRLALGGNQALTVTHLYTHAVRRVAPRIVPFHMRDRDVRKGLSMIRVRLSSDSWHKSLWLPYHHYAFPNDQYRYGMLRYDPTRVILPDGRRIELMYSRQRYPLPTAVALEDFILETHQGGLIGRNSNVRDYISYLRFAQDDGEWSEPVRMSLNNPATDSGFWYFQNFWDSPTSASAGMNYTGLGIGNRNGVHIQLAGTVIAVLGMIYAFYFKPILLRRRRKSVHDQLEQAGRATSEKPGEDRHAASRPAAKTAGELVH